MRLLIVQYAGDYREAFQRLAQEGHETYHAQRYSVEAIAKLTNYAEEVTTLCGITDEAYDEVLQKGLRAIGAGLKGPQDIHTLLKSVRDYNPTHLVLRSPMQNILRWAVRHQIPTLVTLADSFNGTGLRKKWQYRSLAHWLNQPSIEWVGNHGIEAALSLLKLSQSPKDCALGLGISPDSQHFAPKHLRTDATAPTLFYVGSVILGKGVGDLLSAIAELKRCDFPVRLKIAGKGDIEFFAQQAHDLGIEDCVEFLGIVPNHQVIPLMQAADAVVVPSRHEYPEGFPCTIYEALTSRTPLIVSDHPMFQKNLGYGRYASIFPAGDAIALANQIRHLLTDRALYAHFSSLSDEAWQQLQIPVKWGDLLERWLQRSQENQQWLFNHRLISEHYSPSTTTLNSALKPV